ncbi:GNAT family N-acetyltransferase [Fibrella aquatilis]|uniref:GNAT family N-acetyltransferase n=1 Tax=Fibrella aquatilis TaxID=2817059 RepID=A0A939G2C0_9BACT|nr:GNAT family N-acetyltransferase [Fibrella aquatilis]MBO0929878.1 GNAT family N-acetyltransferase [Fibrella aquatilis]
MYRFVTYSSPLPEALPPLAEPGFLVNTVAQLMAQSVDGCWVIDAVNETSSRVDARCAFFDANSLAISPKQQSFGSVEFTRELPDNVLDGFLNALEKAVETAKLTGLRLVHYPRAYAPEQTDRLLAKLSSRGFVVADEQLNFHLKISKKSFTDGLHHSARRRLGKAKRAGLVARYWPNPDLDRVIAFLETSRSAQGYPLTMSADTLRHWLATAPDDYLTFAVFDHDDTLAALTVAVRMRADILYNFLPADNAAYRAYSPTILLTECLYIFCQHHHYTFLDLGICVDEHRQPKPTLMRFKRNLGAEESAKWTWEQKW